MNILVTGGAGFIGSFLVDKLISEGHTVRIYDNLEPQVHHGSIPDYLNKNAEFIHADITDQDKLDKALHNIDIVFHMAAMVGVGQSMYEIAKYTRVNTYGTSLLLDVIVNKHRNHIKKIIVAASMSEYGEGLYECSTCGRIKPELRSDEKLAEHEWEVRCPNCGKPLKPLPTDESTPLITNSIYALNKKDQEEMVLMIGKAFQIPCVALRYFNAYGPRQSLSNPYTGVAAIFMSRIKAGKNLVVFEDGKQSRDFISVHDIVSANIAVMNDSRADYQVFNVGSENKISIAELGKLILKISNSSLELTITEEYRKGDIRHCFADISNIKKIIGWKPKENMEKRMLELAEWGDTQQSVDTFDKAHEVLKKKGII